MENVPLVPANYAKTGFPFTAGALFVERTHRVVVALRPIPILVVIVWGWNIPHALVSAGL
jgi:hypothetical protein